jgi:hypothetical protein
VSYNLSSHLSHQPESSTWSKVKQLSEDTLLGQAEIDYKKSLNAMFNTDNEGEIFFIQGEEQTKVN